jgi:hypothetical protein
VKYTEGILNLHQARYPLWSTVKLYVLLTDLPSPSPTSQNNRVAFDHAATRGRFILK